MKFPTISNKKETIKGGGIVSRILAAEGVDTVFGIIDGSYFGLYSTFGPNGIRQITPRHESDAVHMAGAYARLTGRLGVCIASNGPGVANVLAGVALENAEENRILLITSTRREGISYPDRGGTFQYFPQVDATRPITKWSCNVTTHARIAEIFQTALRKSKTGRPGVMHIDIPENIMSTDYDLNPAWFRAPSSYQTFDPLPVVPQQVEAAARLLSEAKLSMIHAGSGVIHSQAFTELQALAALLCAPVTTSWSARSAMDERSEQAVPVIYGDVVTQIRNDADVALVLGSRLDEADGWGCPPHWAPPSSQKLIQVDPDPEILGANRATDLAVLGDVKGFLTELIERLKDIRTINHLDGRTKKTAAYQKACNDMRKKLDQHLDDKNAPLNPAQVPHICQEIFDEDAIFVIDGGRTAAWCHHFHEVRHPNSLLDAPKMGYVGSGAAHAIGAKAAFPERQVYAVMGDGAMCLGQREIETSVRLNLPVIFIVLCDNTSNPVKPDPFFFLNPETKGANAGKPDRHKWNTRFDLIARAMGAMGERVSDPAGLKSAIRRAMDWGKCAVIHVDVDAAKYASFKSL
ncbi:MAG: thiamine pyrophosphate-binding protein [Deltaproteobacteria bacterium]|nr:thiamine pyrophosphate-binding protein [Deltaproteobacteria bacterium]